MSTYLEKQIIGEDSFFIDRVSIAARVVAQENLAALTSTYAIAEYNKRIALARVILLEGVRGPTVLSLSKLAAAIATDGVPGDDWGDNLIVITPWKAGRDYVIGDKVTSAGLVYTSTANHTSSSLFATDSASWGEADEDIVQGIAGLEIEAVIRTIFPDIAGVAVTDK